MSAPTTPAPNNYPPGELHRRAAEDRDGFLGELRDAEVIVGVFPEGERKVFHGRDLLQALRGIDETESPGLEAQVLRVAIDPATDDIEVLSALVTIVKGEGACRHNLRGGEPLTSSMRDVAVNGVRKETISSLVQAILPKAPSRPAGSIISIGDLIPEERLWPTLTSMGKRPWLKHVPTKGLGFQYRTDYDSLKGIDRAAALATAGVLLSPHLPVMLYLVSRSLASGPKVWRPDWQHCIAFEYSDLRLPWDDLRLAYDPLLIDFPPLYAERWRDHYGDNLPIGAIIGKIGPDSLGIVIRHSQGIGSWCVLHRRPDCGTVEETMRAVYRETGQYVATNSLDPDHYLDTADNTLRRVVLNAAVTLGMIGSRVSGWANPKEHEINARKTNRAARARAGADARRVEPVRLFVGIKFVPPSEHQGGSRQRGGPYFRRGHHKMQHYGPGNAYRKLQWREPQLCNAGPDTDPKDYPRRYEGV